MLSAFFRNQTVNTNANTNTFKTITKTSSSTQKHSPFTPLLPAVTNIIVAFSSKDFAIGKAGGIPWNIPPDLAHFKKITHGHIVVMGRRTWESIGCKPLSNRVNIILSTTCQDIDMDYVHVVRSEDALFSLLKSYPNDRQIFAIGGESIYKLFLPLADKIYATHVDCGSIQHADAFFPVTSNFEAFKISKYGDLLECNGVKYRHIVYQKGFEMHEEHKYLKLMRHIHQRGNKRPDRTGVGTQSIFGPQLEFDIEKSLPLLTTKFVGWKSIAKELLFFLKGQTNTKLLEDQGVNIWRQNTTRQFLDARGLHDYKEGDMGPMYGWIWRHIGAEYKGCDANYEGQGVDQLAALVKGLKDDPYSRRHLLTTYCPLYTDNGVLAPCHGICTQFYVSETETESENPDESSRKQYLSCHVYLRSSDVFLGQPYNIASYAIFTHIIAKMVGMTPKKLILSIGDCHLYKNHIEQCELQYSRSPLPFPVFKVSDTVQNKTFNELELEDLEVVGYLSHSAIKAPMAV